MGYLTQLPKIMITQDEIDGEIKLTAATSLAWRNVLNFNNFSTQNDNKMKLEYFKAVAHLKKLQADYIIRKLT